MKTYPAFNYEGTLEIVSKDGKSQINQKVGCTFCHDGDIESAKAALISQHAGRKLTIHSIVPCVSKMRVTKSRPLIEAAE